MAGIRADNLTDVNARGTETSGAATRSGARAAVSWLLALARDLSPFGAPAPPPRSRWWRWSVWACALVVLGLGTLDLDQHYQLSPGASLALSAARALPILLCLERPLAGWWLELAACRGQRDRLAGGAGPARVGCPGDHAGPLRARAGRG